jgi:serine/threonine protein phosphatase PrpC
MSDLPKWDVIGEGVIGYSHKVSKTSCQDFISYEKLDNGVVIALADGHGSPSCIHSEIGSKLAVETAVDILKNIYYKVYDGKNRDEKRQNRRLEHIEKILKSDKFKKNIEDMWKKKVEDHHKTIYPVVYKTNYIKYGTTLLATLATENFIVYMKIGDGDIFTYSKTESEIYERIIEKDKGIYNLIVNSMCLESAYKYMDIEFNNFYNKKPPCAVFLCTDGYSNSFESDEEIFKSLKNHYEIIKVGKKENIQRTLNLELEIMSKLKSKDDISFGIVYNIVT